MLWGKGLTVIQCTPPSVSTTATAAAATTTTNNPHTLVRATDRTFTRPEAQGPVSTVSCMGRGAAGTHASWMAEGGARSMDGHQSRPPHHNLSLPLASMRRGVAGTIKKLTCGVPKASPPHTPPTAMQKHAAPGVVAPHAHVTHGTQNTHPPGGGEGGGKGSGGWGREHAASRVDHQYVGKNGQSAPERADGAA